jgi:alanine racemase
MPAMSLKSELIAIQDLQPGATIGYGSRFTVEHPMRIGVVACGYADGYPRHAPGWDGNHTPVLVDGVRTHIVGRVSMDMITVDLAGVPEARVGTPVTLWGEGLPIDDVAQASGTVGYELMCALAPRVPVLVEPVGTAEAGDLGKAA